MAFMFKNAASSVYKQTHPASVLFLRGKQRNLFLNGQKRNLSIHEHQAQHFLREAGISVPRGQVITDAEEASRVCQKMGVPSVLKAQILAGGRGKGVFDSGLKGGVHIVKIPDEASALAAQMLGHRLRTKQTSDSGLLVEKVYMTEKVVYEKELYLSIAVDRNNRCPTIVASRHGGMDIEAAGKKDPESITRVPLHYTDGVGEAEAFKIAHVFGLTSDEQRSKIHKILTSMYSLFKSKDATLLEINPLVVTASDDLICLDSKFSFDNAARFRQKDLFALEEKRSLDPREVEAENLGFSYVRLDGNIGNIVNGAGLAMATNDAINHFGGKCANFLDAGGKATKETMVDAFKIVLKDDRVKVMFINIYGGIIHGDMVATSIISAAQESGPLRVPLVVRLQGTSAKKGQAMLAQCGLGIHSVSDFTEAVQLAVELAS